MQFVFKFASRTTSYSNKNSDLNWKRAWIHMNTNAQHMYNAFVHDRRIRWLLNIRSTDPSLLLHRTFLSLDISACVSIAQTLGSATWRYTSQQQDQASQILKLHLETKGFQQSTDPFTPISILMETRTIYNCTYLQIHNIYFFPLAELSWINAWSAPFG